MCQNVLFGIIFLDEFAADKIEKGNYNNSISLIYILAKDAVLFNIYTKAVLPFPNST